ncbi:MAG: hypothetical protein ACI81R_002526 [Bradymonadia bacterium]|jgi:hypothetical protein
MNRIAALVLTLFVSLMLPASAYGTTVVAEPLVDAMAASEMIVRARVVSQRSEWVDGRIVTITELEPLEELRGDVLPETLEVLTLGGQVGELRAAVAGVERYSIGEEVVVIGDCTPEGRLVSRAMSFTKFSVMPSEAGLVATRDVSVALAPSPSALISFPDIDVIRVSFRLDELRAWADASRGY